MKKLLDWLKENPISAASALVALVCLGLFGYFLLIAAGSLTNKIVAENEKDANTLKTLQDGSVSLPDPDPNNPPIVVDGLVINEEVIARIRTIYEGILAQQLFIKGETEQINKQNHEGNFIVAFDAITAGQIDAFGAAERYEKSFQAMLPPRFEPSPLDAAEVTALGMPTFRAGPPPPMQWIVDVQAQAVDDYLKTLGATSANALTKDQAEGLYLQQKSTLLNQLTQWAYGLDFYADLPQAELIEIDPERYKDLVEPGAQPLRPAPTAPRPGGFRIPGIEGGTGGGTTAASPGQAERFGPFTMAAWASAEAAPTLEQLWEGQVELWIIRDLMTTIAEVNQVGTMVNVVNADGETVEMPQNVVTAPVKRLVDVSVVPYYVGLHTLGGMAGPDSTGTGALLAPASSGQSLDPESGEFAEPQPLSSGTFGGTANTAGTQADQSVYPPPAVLALPEPDQPLEGNFYFGPTGRRSNSIYDVRHVWMTMHIQSDALPKFFETLRQVNFMTVINMQVNDVDEYRLLQEGYIYGDADVVEVTLTIETLWFRTWTTDYMPEIVKKKLVVAEEPDIIAE